MSVARVIRGILSIVLVCACAGSASAQTAPRAAPQEPAISLRPFFLVTGEHLSADETFDAVLGDRALRPFLGGGVQIDFRGGWFVEVAVSHFSETGQRVFVSNGQVFPLGIPLKTTITPLLFTGGYRFTVSRSVRPYVGVGVGRFAYSEESSFDAPGDGLSTSAAGFAAMGGVEVRLHKWVAVGIDAEYTHVPNVLGTAGVSQAFGENDLGGTAVRVKILAGR
jgi:opacity protein-like surface antigen